MIEEILMYFFNKVMYILNEYKTLNSRPLKTSLSTVIQ